MMNTAPMSLLHSLDLDARRQLLVRALLCDDLLLRDQLRTETNWVDEPLWQLTTLLDATDLPDTVATLAIDLNLLIGHKVFSDLPNQTDVETTHLQ